MFTPVSLPSHEKECSEPAAGIIRHPVSGQPRPAFGRGDGVVTEHPVRCLTSSGRRRQDPSSMRMATAFGVLTLVVALGACGLTNKPALDASASRDLHTTSSCVDDSDCDHRCATAGAQGSCRWAGSCQADGTCFCESECVDLWASVGASVDLIPEVCADTPGEVPCPTMTCRQGTACISTEQDIGCVAHCGVVSQSCSGPCDGVAICDGPEDCPAGEDCVGMPSTRFSSCWTAWCEPRNAHQADSTILCHCSSECPAGLRCAGAPEGVCVR